MKIKKITELTSKLYEKSWLQIFTIGTIVDGVSTRIGLSKYEDSARELNPLANYLMERFNTDIGLTLMLTTSVPILYGMGKFGEYLSNKSFRSRSWNQHLRFIPEIYKGNRAFSFGGLVQLVVGLRNFYQYPPL